MSNDKPRYRGFALSHQKATLDVSLATGLLSGITDLTILPTSSDLRVLYFHFRQGRIKNVSSVSSSLPLSFTHNDPFQSLVLSNPTEPKTYPEAKRKAFAAFAEGEEGELAIRLEDGCVRRGGASGEEVEGGAGTGDWMPVVVRIEFEVRAGGEGLALFGALDGDDDLHVPHLYTSPTAPDAARCWIPCVDNLWERCTWELDFVVARRLIDYNDPDEDGRRRKKGKGKEKARAIEQQPEMGMPIIVACSGELVEHVCHPSSSTKSIFRFVQSIPTSVQHISFAVGPFHVVALPPTPSDAALPSMADDQDQEDDAVKIVEEDSSQPPIHVFVLPGMEDTVQISTAFIRQGMDFLTTEYGSYPFSTFNLVFVDEPVVPSSAGAAMAIFDSDLLHPKDIIDQAYETRLTLSHALAFQWVGINIVPKTWSDTWLINGLSLYITGLFLRKLLGNNEYRFRLKMDSIRCADMDNGTQHPICLPGSLDPPDAATLPFVNLKSGLVLHILDRRLGKTGTSLGLSRVIPKIFLSAITGDLANNALSTQAFLRMCRKVSGVDMRSFAEQWIWGSGCPSLLVTAHFNKKKMLIEMTCRQTTPAVVKLKEDPVMAGYLKPTPWFEGQMTVRIHEADGTPYEHVLDIREGFKTYDVPFNTKYKRVRRNTKRYLARKAAAAAAAEGDADAAEAMGMLDLGFDLAIWEEEEEREKWRVADWTENEENDMVGAPYEWIRLDADFEWIANVRFDQQDFYWVSQLQRDRDVVAQVDAMHVLRRNPTSINISILAKTILVTNYFFRVRIEAAKSLVHGARENDHLGLFQLLKIFQSRYCFPPEVETTDAFQFTCIPRPNDFSDFAEHLVQKAVLVAISHCHDGIHSWPVVTKLMVDLLKYNDNSVNPYCDGAYIATVMSCLAFSLVMAVAPGQLDGYQPNSESAQLERRTNSDLLQQGIDQVTRYMTMDRLVPSYHNVVTIAGLDLKLQLTMLGLIPNDVRFFLGYTREGNYVPVRLAAFDCLLIASTPGSKMEIANYLFTVAARDSSRVVRRHVARGICEALVFALTIGTIRVPPQTIVPGEPKQPVDEIDVVLKTLRKEVGKSTVMRSGLMNVIASTDVDFEVRWAMIQLAEMLVKPNDEEIPKAIIYQPPPSPAIEAPLATPKIKLFTGAISQPSTPATPGYEPNTAIQSGLPSPALRFVLNRPPPGANGPPPTPPLATPTSAKKKKEKVAVKAQRSGMPHMDLIVCRNLLPKLEQHKNAIYFRAPVDPVRDGAIDYFTVIKNPMDLSTVKAKLEDGQYSNRFEFRDDVYQISANALIYNQPQSPIGKMAEKFRSYFDKQWETTEAVLNTNAKAPEPSSFRPPPAPAAGPSSGTPAVGLRISIPANPNAAASAAMPPPPVPASAIQAAAAASASSSQSPAGTPIRPTIKLKNNVSFKLGGSTTPSPAPSPALSPAPAAAEEAPPLPPPVLTNPYAKVPKPPKAPIPAAVPSHAPPLPPAASTAVDNDDPFADELDLMEAPAVAAPPPPKVQPPPPPPPRPPAAAPPPPDAAAPPPPPRPALKFKFKPIIASPAPAAAPAPVADEATPKKHKSKDKDRERHRSQSGGTEPSPGPSSYASTPFTAFAPHPARAYAEAPPPPTAYVPPPPPPPPPAPLASTSKAPAWDPATATGFNPRNGSNGLEDLVGNRESMNPRRGKIVIQSMLKLASAQLFARPVNPVLDGCPTYLDEIKKPMDLGTMEARVTKGKYRTWGDFASDMQLMFDNCRTFNPPGPVTQMADEVERHFRDKEWPKAMSRKMIPEEKKELGNVLNKLWRWPGSEWFRDPVDPIALNIPTYFSTIPHPRSLSTIKSALATNPYYTSEEFYKDLNLVVENARVFNGAESPVGAAASALERWWRGVDPVGAVGMGGSGRGERGEKRKEGNGEREEGGEKKMRY